MPAGRGWESFEQCRALVAAAVWNYGAVVQEGALLPPLARGPFCIFNTYVNCMSAKRAEVIFFFGDDDDDDI